MGKSIDLPDPLESASSAPLGNADDLLAQLAGEEVDRLLAEADSEGELPARRSSGAEAKIATEASPESSGIADPASLREPAIQEQLDTLFSDIQVEQSKDAPSAMRLSAPSAPRAAPAVTALIVANPTELETTSEERTALAKSDRAEALPGPGEIRALTTPVENDAPLPLYLKPLEWINAPLDLLPPAARDVLGQIAILTLVNAIAVLIYVFVFRRQ